MTDPAKIAADAEQVREVASLQPTQREARKVLALERIAQAAENASTELRKLAVSLEAIRDVTTPVVRDGICDEALDRVTTPVVRDGICDPK